MKAKLLPCLLALVLTAAALPARAHYLWIDAATDGRSAKIYFGEYQEDVREVKGGRLDEMTGQEVFALGSGAARTPLTPAVNQDHFLVSATAAASGFITQKLDYPVKDWTKSGIGIVKPIFYARGWVSGQPLPKAELTLDVVPVDASAQAVKVFFNRKPLPKAKVKVHAPNLWSRELEADENGALTIPAPWPGLYVIEVIHLEATPGIYQATAYTAVRHRATLTLSAK